ncbi:MAG: polyphenol oxidase family protein [Candidatus Omnitrophica bacterium]|nr:polyphenol oxidase family protein [Candidatus Omnitrophota bacterium]
MKLVEREHCILIENFFSSNIIAGFTKSNLDGNLPSDIYTAVSSLSEGFRVRHMRQSHSNQVNCLVGLEVSDSDGLFTKERQEAVVVKSADCLPIYFSSQELGAIGVVHMGWRSAAKGILDNINYNLKSFKVVLGVGLRRCCYRIGKEFLEYSRLTNCLQQDQEQLYFDPIKFVKEELFKKGLKSENLYDLDFCSFCSEVPAFSYRRTNADGRTLSFILRKQ